MRVAVYCRISRDVAGLSAGVERQAEACAELAAQRGWSVVETFTDNDISAWSGTARPAFDALLEAVGSGDVDAVVVWHVDRLVRSMRDLERVIDLAVDVYSVQAGQVDLSTPGGRAIARTLTAWAGYESDIKSARLRAKHEQLALAGSWASGRCFGYSALGVVVEREAEVIRDVAFRLLAGESLRSVTQRLNDVGVPTVRGGSWRTTTVKAMICAARLSAQREHTPRSEGRSRGRGVIVGEGSWQPVLTKEQTAALRALFDRAQPKGRPVEHLLSGGLAVCARCGSGLLTANDKRLGRRYACIKTPGSSRCGGLSVVAAQLEDIVLLELMTYRKTLFGLVRQKRAASVPPGHLVAEVESLEVEMSDLARDYGDGVISRTDWVAARGGLSKRLESARAQLDQIQSPEDRVSELLQVFFRDLDSLSVEDRRRVLRRVVAGVVVSPAPVRGRPRVDDARVRVVLRE